MSAHISLTRAQSHGPKLTGQRLGYVDRQTHVYLMNTLTCTCHTEVQSLLIFWSFPILLNFSHHNKPYPIIIMKMLSEEQRKSFANLTFKLRTHLRGVCLPSLTPSPMVNIANQLTHWAPTCSLRIPNNPPADIKKRIVVTYLPSQTKEIKFSRKACFLSFKVLLNTHHCHLGRAFWSCDCQKFGII